MHGPTCPLLGEDLTARLVVTVTTAFDPWRTLAVLRRQSRRTLPLGALVGAYSSGRIRTIAVTRRHLLLLTLLLAAPAVTRAEDNAPPPVPRFEPAPCPKLQGAEALAKASCGYLVVPENRSRPTGRKIRLMVAKYPARSPEKRADPVVYLAGGRATSPPWRSMGSLLPISSATGRSWW